MHLTRSAWLWSLFLVPLAYAQSQPAPPPSHGVPEPEIFAPGIISSPANDGSPTFSPDGDTLFFTRSTAHWSVILESHRLNSQWSHPTLAPFSGEWPDSSPAMAPDGSYLAFQSTRPKSGTNLADAVSNLWRVDRRGGGWSKPVRLPDTVNLPGQSIWKPSIAADGTVYFVVIDKTGSKRLFLSQLANGALQPAQPLAFSDGTKADVDPEIAPDGSFLVFCSAARLAGDEKDHLFFVARTGTGWGPVTPIRYAGDDRYGYSTDDEPHLGADHRTLFFNSDRPVPVHFPRAFEQAQKDVVRMESWDNSNSNVWMISISDLLPAS